MESYEIIWKNALPHIQDTVSSISFNTYVKYLEPIDLVGTTLVLLAKTEVFAKVIKTRLKGIIVEALKKLDTGITDIEIFQGSSKKEYLESKSEIDFQDKTQLESSPIDPKYTFDSFVVGESNRYLYAAAKAVAEDPGNTYNPLFIYGASGLGKTHIMHAIANYLKKHRPKTKVLYSTCEKFTTELIGNIRSGKAYSQEGVQFKNRYRNVDVLIIDDVQFLARKEKTQEEFFNTFNALYSENKQIILSADCEPKEIELLDNRLRTRFEGGLQAKVVAPDLETKVAILQKKAEYKKHILPIDVAMFIAENSDDNVRSLEGMLNKVIFASILYEKPITLELTAETLKESVNNDIKESVTTTKIIDTVCSYYKISKSDITSKKRNKELVEPRQICAYLMTELMSIPLVTIGQALGGKNYTTVIHSRDKIAELIKFSDKISTAVNDIKNLILKK